MALSREDWLYALARRMAPKFEELGFPLPKFRAAIGWPSGGKDAPVTGECWNKTISGDEHFEIFLNPGRADSMLVAFTFCHELIHASVGLECGHKGAFAMVAKSLGFATKLTEAQSPATSPKLAQWIGPMVDELGALPHAAINYSRGGSAMIRRNGAGVSPVVPKAAPADDGEGGEPAEAPANNRPPKQDARMIKCTCAECGYVARTTRKWLEIGPPHCPTHGAMEADA